MRRLLSLLAVLVLPLFGQAHAPTSAAKSTLTDASRGGTVSLGAHAWDLSDAERIERRAAANESGNHGKRVESAGVRFAERLEGAEHPELLLPYELFDHLLNAVGTDDRLRDNAHTLYDPKLKLLGYDVAGFWSRLSSLAHSYVDARSARHGHLGSTSFTTTSGKRFFVPISRDLCVARVATLQDARRAFGAKQFDRLLYTVVAPGISETTTGNMTMEDRAEQLRYMTGGCQ
jgi:hypothetical protein